MLFGVNLFNNETLYDYLTDFLTNLKKLTWINDFTCIAEFDSEEFCIKAYKELQHNANANANTNDTNDTNANANTNNIDNSELHINNDWNWKLAKSYKLNDILVNDIEIRISETNDILKKCAKDEAVYYKYYDREEIKKRNENNNNRRNNFVYEERINNHRNLNDHSTYRLNSNTRFNSRNFNNSNLTKFENYSNDKFHFRHQNNYSRFPYQQNYNRFDRDRDYNFNNGHTRTKKFYNDNFDNYHHNNRRYKDFSHKINKGKLNKNEENGELSKRSSPIRERSRSNSLMKKNYNEGSIYTDNTNQNQNLNNNQNSNLNHIHDI